MREIKFRAWHTVNNVMYAHKDIPVLLKNAQDDDVWKYMMFTGLKDKNGKDIYHGDVLKFVGGTCHNLTSSGYHRNEIGTVFVVSWLYSGWTLQLPSVIKMEHCDIPNIISNVTNYDFWNNAKSLQIIGNIHQHPQLL